MGKKEMHFCDGCGKTEDQFHGTDKYFYKLVLSTDRFWDGIEFGERVERLEFCPKCAREIKEALLRVARKMEDGQE